MKQFQIRGGAQAHFDLFTLRHNFRVFPRGKRKGLSPARLEGLDVRVDDWSELIYPEEDSRIDLDTIFQSFKRQEKEGPKSKSLCLISVPLSKIKQTIIIKCRIDVFLDKKLEIKAEGEVKNRKVNPTGDKGSFQEKMLKDYFFFWKLSTKE